MCSFRPVSFASLALRTLSALAIAGSSHAAEATAAAVPSLGSSLLQMFFALLAVIGLLLGSLWLLKKLTLQRASQSGLMRVVSATAVGHRERVVILEIGNTWLVLGVAPGRVDALAEMPRQPLPPAASTDRALTPSWLSRLFPSR